jgi:hypothetical protein
VSPQAGKGALHWAAQYALPGEELARLARAPGAARAADSRGNTPLMLAALGASPAHLCAQWAPPTDCNVCNPICRVS